MSAPVIISGAGPVGLTTALALARADVDVVLLEQRPEPALDARATTVQPPVLEILESLGVLEPLLARGRRVDRLQYWDLRSGTVLADLDFGLIADRTRFPFRLHVPQVEVVDVLSAELKRIAPGALRPAHKVTGFTDRGSDVAVDVTTHGAKVTVTGSTLVAADGFRSGIRSDLQIDMDVAHAPVAFVSARADLALIDALQLRLGPSATAVAPVSYVLHDDSWAMIMAMRDHTRLLLPAEGEDLHALSQEAMLAQTRAILGPDWDVELQSLALYHVTQRVARTWRKGRVVLAGDAAHSAWPVGGTSMNFGMIDGWQLAVALREGSERALDAYAADRNEEARRALLSRADKQMHLVDPWGMWERQARRRLLEAVSSDEEQARRHLRQLSLLPVD